MLDEMARDRYNVLSLWNLHPFPSMVKVPEYPDVALQDVMRSTEALSRDDSHKPMEVLDRDFMGHLEVVKTMTIEEKIEFWRAVMQYAHDRGIETYIFTWNTFVWGAQDKYGITDDLTNPTTINYFRKSVRELILTYPLLAGIGITAGEHMGKNTSEKTKEQWLWQAYGEGVRDAKAIQPDRSVRLIHRYHQTGLDEILSAWKEYPDTLDLSYKYSVAHMYSSAAPPFAKKELAELPSNLRMWMTVRNDDIYSYRWGDPEFARAYISNFPGPDELAGYYMGPDGYIWGREFIDKEPETPRQLVMKKQWFSFTLWGRLSYDPTLPDSLFRQMLAARFPEVDAERLLTASVEASKIIPLTTRFYWRNIDLKWFPEACIAHPAPSGFQTVEGFMRGETMSDSGILNIQDYAKALLAGETMEGVTPPQVAEELHAHAKAAIDIVSSLDPGANKELRLTLGDYRAMALLGHYYAEKILGATDLALFDMTADESKRQSAVQHLESALDWWKQYAAVATSQYAPQILTRIGYCDLNALVSNVEDDVRIAREWQSGTLEK
ncbi:MAG: carbohydrate-binding family 6 protein [Candidatus Sumerlaeota bacterium]|nr:carbohydrate-binding family 6 protein [Candidatus Sumerlaeota bacterium]